MNNHTRSDKRTLWGMEVNPPVFISSLIVVLTLVLATFIAGESMSGWFSRTQKLVSDYVGWFFILLVNGVLFFSLYLGLGKFGRIRIGGKEAKPDFSRLAWFSMLFSAGMGIGLLFWSVAEPITHFNGNPFISSPGDKVAAAKEAMGVTFLHWGVHAWALYAVVGAALAFFTFNKKLPLTIRSIFYPVLKDRIYGPIGDIIDTVAVIATIFGLATSLGLGAQQVNAGLSYVFNIESTSTTQIVIIAAITFMATLSLLLGLKKGIKILSQWNMRLAFVLLIFLLVVGPTLFLLKSFVQNLGHYVYEFFDLSFWTNSFRGLTGGGAPTPEEGSSWQNGWTIFYWAWWISWSPFVGLFIARISKGRTIKEFVLGVLLVPSLLTFLWLTVFGGSAIFQELIGNHAITQAVIVDKDVPKAIFLLLEQYPYTSISSILTIILIASFFITSSDSGSYVVDVLISGGRQNSPKGQKIFWASMEGLVAAVLLLSGGLVALQTASILASLPFAILIIILCISFRKSLKEEYNREYKPIIPSSPKKEKPQS